MQQRSVAAAAWVLAIAAVACGPAPVAEPVPTPAEPATDPCAPSAPRDPRPRLVAAEGLPDACEDWTCLEHAYAGFVAPSVLAERQQPIAGDRWGRLVPYGNGVITRAALESSLEAFLAAPTTWPSPEERGPAPTDLAHFVAHALGIEQLLARLEQRPLEVATASVIDHGDYVEELLYVEDVVELPTSGQVERFSVVGALEVRLLVPAGERAAGPAIVAVHGHGQTRDEALEKLAAIDLVRRGFVVAIPVIRTLAHPVFDTSLAPLALESGFTLKGVQTFEVALVEKLLRGRAEVDPSRIGAICHSGGCGAVGAWERLSRHLAFAVIDFFAIFRDTSGVSWRQIHCDDVPSLFDRWFDVGEPPESMRTEIEPRVPRDVVEVRDRVSNAAGLPVHRVLVPYGLGGSRAAVLDDALRCLVERDCCGGLDGA